MDMMVTKRLLKKIGDMEVLDMEATVRQAQAAMCKSGRDHLPVIDARDKVFGMLSSFDILQFHDTGADPRTTRAWEICSHKLVTCEIEQPLQDIVQVMHEMKLHHVLIRDGGYVKGLISAWDILGHFLGDTTPKGSA